MAKIKRFKKRKMSENNDTGKTATMNIEQETNKNTDDIKESVNFETENSKVPEDITKKDIKSDETAQVQEQEQKQEQEQATKEDIPQKSPEETIKEFQDKYLRLAAEFDNYRKRTLKEKMELIKTAGEDILINILPVIDDFERAQQSISSATDIEPVKQGINLIYNKFIDFLKQRGIKEIEAKEKEFNTEFHEAVTKIPVTEEALKGKIVDVIEKGYFLHDKVIRYSKVVIGE
ncbi:MAG: nucleotide exchange factor GrpE [Bacteroidia bacterium]|nr:nucleotide exchange factor GrpE [Bacteroidia bacterium]